MSTFQTHLLTPDGSLYDGETVAVNVPGVKGDFQVLVNHAALMSTLDVGYAKLVTSEKETIEYALSGGFIEVNDNNVTVLTEAAEQVSNIDVERAKASLDRALERMKDSTMDRVRAEASLKRAMNRLKLAGAL